MSVRHHCPLASRLERKAHVTSIVSWMAFLWACALVACTARTEVTLPAPENALPANGVLSGWARATDNVTYDENTLYDFMDGAADLYFTYGFEKLAVGQYEDTDGTALQVEIYRVTTDADAYGLFTYNSYGEPTGIGVDGELEDGYRLAFWQRRTFVQIVARDQVDDAVLRAFGEAVTSALPEGGERPMLVEALPEDGMEPGSTRFFREKIALDNLLWIGSEDVLGLDADTGGVLARYEIGGQHVDLVLVAFPDSLRAQAAQSGLEGAEVKNLAGTDVQGNVFGAAFSPSGQGAAKDLLARAMAASQ